MARKKQTETNMSERIVRRPALTPEARENQLIAEAIDLVEQRILNGTASSQETTHFLKLGSTKAQYEKEVLKMQRDLMQAKIDNIKSYEKNEEFQQQVIEMFKKYSGEEDDI